MHPDFRHYMNVKRGGNAFRFRVTDEERVKLEEIVNAEGGTLTELLVEGVWRVIENRNTDPQFQARRDEAVALQARLDELRDSLHSSELP